MSDDKYKILAGAAIGTTIFFFISFFTIGIEMAQKTEEKQQIQLKIDRLERNMNEKSTIKIV